MTNNNSEIKDGDWVRKDIGEFKIDLGPQVDLDSEDVPIDFSDEGGPIQGEEFVLRKPAPAAKAACALRQTAPLMAVDPPIIITLP